MFWQDLAIQIVLKLLPVIALLFVGLLIVGLNYLKKKLDFIKNETARKMVTEAIRETEKVARDSIMNVQQTFVEDIKKKKEDGKLTKQEAMQALNKAKNKFIENLSNDTIKVIEESIGPVEQYAENLLEARLKEIKDQNKSQIEKELQKLANPKSKGSNLEDINLDSQKTESG